MEQELRLDLCQEPIRLVGIEKVGAPPGAITLLRLLSAGNRMDFEAARDELGDTLAADEAAGPSDQHSPFRAQGPVHGTIRAMMEGWRRGRK